MRNVSLRTFLLMAVIIGIFTVFAGCGGGSGDITNNSGGNGLIDVPDGGTSSGSGTFEVSLTMPKTEALEEQLSASVIPVLSRTLRVALTGDGIDTANAGTFIKTVDIAPGSTGTVTFTDVPVGLKTARIEVLDTNGVILAQRTYSFFMDPGETESPGALDLGVAIDGSGACVPSSITIPIGTQLFYENQDTTAPHTISLASGQFTVGPIAPVTPSDGLATPAVYHTGTINFNVGGTFNYDAGFGAPGSVTVIDTTTLSITSIDNGIEPAPVINPPTEISDYDVLPPTQSVNITIQGAGFGPTREFSDGNVQFTEIDPNTPEAEVVLATINSWTENQITCSVTLAGGLYRVEVLAYGSTTAAAGHTPNVFYDRALWQNIVDERFSIGQAIDLAMYVTDNVNVMDPSPFANPRVDAVPFIGYLDGAFQNFDVVYSYNLDEYATDAVWKRHVATVGANGVSGSIVLRKDATDNIDIYAAFIVYANATDAVPPVFLDEDKKQASRLGFPGVEDHREVVAIFSDNGAPGEVVAVSPNFSMYEPPFNLGGYWYSYYYWTVTELWDAQEVGMEVDDDGVCHIIFTMKDIALIEGNLSRLEDNFVAYTATYNPLNLAGIPGTSQGATAQERVYPNPQDPASFGIPDSGGFPTTWLNDPANYYYEDLAYYSYPNGPQPPEYYGGISKFEAKEVAITNAVGINRVFATFQDESNQNGITVLTFPRTDAYDAPTTGLNDQDWPPTSAYVPTPPEVQWSVVGKPGFSQGKASSIDIDFFKGRPFTLFQDREDGKLTLFAYTGVYADTSTSGWEIIGERGGIGNGSTDVSLFMFDPDDGDNGDPEPDDEVFYASPGGNISIGIPYVAFSNSKGQVKRYYNGVWEQVGKSGFSLGTASYLSLYVYGKDFDGYLTPVAYVGYQDQTLNQTATVQKFEMRPIQNP